MREERRHKRVAFPRPVSIRLSDGTRAQARAVNISCSGIGIMYPIAASLGAVLELYFSIPVKKSFHNVVVKGEIKHNHLVENEYFIGIEFIGIRTEDEEMINYFVANKVHQRKISEEMLAHIRKK